MSQHKEYDSAGYPHKVKAPVAPSRSAAPGESVGHVHSPSDPHEPGKPCACSAAPPFKDWAEKWAKDFHDTYERSAPAFGYETRKESAKPWADVPENNRKLMIAVCAEVLCRFEKERTALYPQASAAPPSANCVYEIRPDDPPPSCHVCGAVMVPTRFNCRSCGATTEPTEAAPPSEREALEQQAAYYFSEIRKFSPLNLDHYSLENWKDFIVWRAAVPQAAADEEVLKALRGAQDTIQRVIDLLRFDIGIRKVEARAAAVPAPAREEHPRCPRDQEGTTFSVVDKDGIFYVCCGVCNKFLGIWDGRFGHKLRDIPVAGATAPPKEGKLSESY